MAKPTFKKIMLNAKDEIKKFKAGFVTISGPPNSGKSTLLNTLCNAHLGAVSQKPHTTRIHVKGILTTENYQIVFIDTPGFIKPVTKLEKLMEFETKRALKYDADITVLCIEPNIKILEKNLDFIKSYFNNSNKEIITTVTKIDIYDKKEIEETKNLLKKINNSSIILEISSIKKININILIDEIIKKLPVSPPYYPDDILSDKWERFFVSELIRETVFELYEQEVPYSVAVSIEIFDEKRIPIYILAYLYVSKKTHKIIIIGENGKKIKLLREKSQEKIKNFLNKEIKLEIYVKIRENWQNDEKFINKITEYYK
ncbi:MAG: GTPase Era [Candidatus Goldbacteria bacterium]|nr:GTPase Era [Candidatus Goldiibacteriota bacterium]